MPPFRSALINIHKLGDGIFDKATNTSLIESVWASLKSGQTSNLHEFCKIGVESIIREALIKKSVDNVTAILIVFESMEKMIANQHSKLNERTSDKTPHLKSEASTGNTSTADPAIDRTSLPDINREALRGNRFAKDTDEKATRNLKLKISNEISSNALFPSILKHKSQPSIEESKFQRNNSVRGSPKITKFS